jgi:hypothetical protein
MSHEDAAVYRRRAAHLRSLSRQLTTTSSMSLHLHAGADTWYGPRAEACVAELCRAQHDVRDAADDLIGQAIRFERFADDLDAAALRVE